MSIYPISCEAPGCVARSCLSGLCELHYWKREAERLSAEAAMMQRPEHVDYVVALRTRNDALTQLARRIEDLVSNETFRTDAGWREVLTAAVTEQHAKPVTKPPLSLTRETVLSLTPRAAKPPPTMVPPIDVAVEKEGKR